MADDLSNALVQWELFTAEREAAILQPEKLITYVHAANGVFEIRKTPIGLVLSPAEKPIVPSPLGRIEPGLMLSIPKIPWSMLVPIVGFFRAVATQHHGAEALVRIFRSEAGEWRHVVPIQMVSGASVRDVGETNEAGIHVMDIHSHGPLMGAFFSAGDDTDECKGVRLYGVMGKINHERPEMRFRLWTGMAFLPIEIATIFDAPDDPPAVRANPTWLDCLTGTMTVQLPSPLAEPCPFPVEWLGQIRVREKHPPLNGKDYDWKWQQGDGWSEVNAQGRREWQGPKWWKDLEPIEQQPRLAGLVGQPL